MSRDDDLIKALEVLDAEKQNNSTYEVIHEHIEPLLYNASDAVLKAIAEKKKTIAGAVSQMQTEAKKKLNGKSSCAVISDTEGFAICKKYFGVADSTEQAAAVTSIFDLM